MAVLGNPGCLDYGLYKQHHNSNSMHTIQLASSCMLALINLCVCVRAREPACAHDLGATRDSIWNCHENDHELPMKIPTIYPKNLKISGVLHPWNLCNAMKLPRKYDLEMHFIAHERTHGIPWIDFHDIFHWGDLKFHGNIIDVLWHTSLVVPGVSRLAELDLVSSWEVCFSGYILWWCYLATAQNSPDLDCISVTNTKIAREGRSIISRCWGGFTDSEIFINFGYSECLQGIKSEALSITDSHCS